jgi:multidrug transporter EmrE-like cation transporter
MSEIAVNYLLSINIEPSYTNLRKLEVILFRNLNYLKRLTGGSEDVNKAIEGIQRLIMILRTAMITLKAFEAAAGPVGWAYAITTGVGLVLTSGDLVYDAIRGN